jgi:CspA family cold shock protein
VLIKNLIFITMAQGTVKFFNDSKGFGFITEEGSDKDHFVHISGLIDEVREGDVVEFDLQEGRKGMNAVNVKVV